MLYCCKTIDSYNHIVMALIQSVAREIAWNVLKVEILIGRMIHCSLCSYTFVFSSVRK